MILGLDGDDRIEGDLGNDLSTAATATTGSTAACGDDTLRGNDGDDILIGRDGNDTLEGGARRRHDLAAAMATTPSTAAPSSTIRPVRGPVEA